MGFNYSAFRHFYLGGILMAATNKNIISKLLKEGTSAGPVNQEMIDWCFERARVYGSVKRYGWMDWLSQSRDKFRPTKIK
jgi:hypothetical protein